MRGPIQVDVLTADAVKRCANAFTGEHRLRLGGRGLAGKQSAQARGAAGASGVADTQGPRQADRLGHGGTGEQRLLRQIRHLAAPLLRRELACRAPLKLHGTMGVRVQLGERGEQTALARAGRADQIDDLAAFDGEAQTLEYCSGRIGIRDFACHAGGRKHILHGFQLTRWGGGEEMGGEFTLFVRPCPVRMVWLTSSGDRLRSSRAVTCTHKQPHDKRYGSFGVLRY